MAHESNTDPQAHSGLPPVVPPSGRLLGQLFLVPALIVAGVVGILLFFNWLVSGPRDTASILRKLDEPNPEVRWRAAADLSQVLLRDDDLAADPNFALALALRLEKAQSDAAAPEEILAAKVGKLSPEEARKEQTKLEQERNYVNYLAASLGNFLVPVGAPVLEKLAVTDKGLEPKALAARRRAALWALANLGQNLKRFDKLPSVQQEAILASLLEPQGNGEQAHWAAAARRHLQSRVHGLHDAMDMDRTIESCAKAEDPYLRELAAFVSNFWAGDTAAEARIEETLVHLSYDTGPGEELLEEWATDDKAETRAVTKNPGLKVRMNAVIALARRGSAKVRIEMLQEMLDEETLRKTFVLRGKNGQEQPDEGAVLSTIMNTLKAVGELHRKRPDAKMPEVRAAVDKLATHGNAAIRSEAKETQLALAT